MTSDLWLCGGELRFKANHSIKSWIPWQKSLWLQELCCVLPYLVFSGVTHNLAMPCSLFPLCFHRLQSSSEPAHPWNGDTAVGTPLGDIDPQWVLMGGAFAHLSMVEGVAVTFWRGWCQGTEAAVTGMVWHGLGGVRWTEVVAQSGDGDVCDAGQRWLP